MPAGEAAPEPPTDTAPAAEPPSAGTAIEPSPAAAAPEASLPLPPAAPPAAAAPPRDRPAPRQDRPRGPRPVILEMREPLYRETGGYTLRLDPPDLARLRELPGSKEKTDRELGELFFDAHSARLTGAVSDDVPAPAELRVVVDPFSRQAFLAVGRTIRGIVSF